MFTDSFTVPFRNVSTLAVLVVIAADRSLHSFPMPHMLYGRKDGLTTVRCANSKLTRSVNMNGAVVTGVTWTGTSVILSDDLSTHEGRVRWLREHPEAYAHNGGTSRIMAIKRLRIAAYDAGHGTVGLKDAKEATDALL